MDSSFRLWLTLWLSRVSPHALEIRPIPPVIDFYADRDPEKITHFVTDNQSRTVYFGILGRGGTTGGKESIREAHCLWADIDFKDLAGGKYLLDAQGNPKENPNWSETEARLEADGIIATFDHRPTLQIASGGGYHLYWFLEEPTTDLDRVERILRGLAPRLKADTSAAEFSRVLRLPDSMNWKYNPPRPVKVAAYSPESSYSLENFAEWEHDEATKGAKVQDWFKNGRRDNDMHYLGCCLARGGAPRELTRDVIIRAMNSWGENDLGWAEAKVKAAYKTVGKADRNLSEDIRGWITATEGWFSSVQADKELEIDNKKTRQRVFERLVEAGFIQKDKQREGYYRKVESDLERINILDEEGQEVPLVLPFDIHHKVKIFPKNIIVAAGEPNAGKTALLFNIARDNQDKMEVDYFSSEMGRLEIRERLSHFNWPLSAWKVNFYERAGNFDQVMNPNHLTIIDFLEIYDRFWEIGAIMRDIYDKLDKGVAIIAIQKNPTRRAKDGNITGELGLGGYRGLEKARLYLTMGRGRIKIFKGKNWRTQENPNGLQHDFKLVGGCNFILEGQGGWYREPTPEPKAPSKERDFVHEE